MIFKTNLNLINTIQGNLMWVIIYPLMALSFIGMSCTDEDDDQVIAEEPQLIIRFKYN